MPQVFTISLKSIEDCLFNGKIIDLSELPMDKVQECYDFLKDFAAKKIIYGINTGFGPMAQWRVDDKYLTDLQYNIIRSHSTGAGEPLPDIYVKASMIARLGTFLQARSGVHPDLVRLLVEMINRGIYPFIPQHGSVGASGDLVQLAHMALCMIGEGRVHYHGEWRPSAEVLAENGLEPFRIHIREGLSISNGTSFMTGIGLVNQHYADILLDWATLASVMMNEIASSFDDLMSEELNEVRRHEGQQVIAARMRRLAKGSRCLEKREHELYDGGHEGTRTFNHKVQAYYSLRCAPQILGPVYETYANASRVLEEEVNSACDNPIVDPVSKNVYHGGNFHGDYISLEEDKVKIATVRLAMTAERQLNYLFHDRINGILPPFLNMGTLGLNYGMQACQFTATSTTAECQTLAMPNYVHSIPNNNDNQDIVSMGTNSALLTKRVIDNAYQVFSIHFIALAQAVDCLSLADKLAPTSKKIYSEIRDIAPKFVEDRPFYEQIAKVEEYLREKPLALD
ncbi:MAG: aromatic amino acid ammonia-lyase [Bacteroidales bacterium]|jgi:histidine ammonia-lyase|nr:aromatic amino acid ammonia-lyase [Bacteroidales bacterium]MCI2135201.1 aromatic amino acid ammonia-lyase [Bacteroidales bacterium]MDY6320397.1 aromatic amino acid ammonia-lyase [Bacteroidales bacterium]MDY6377382.1 aromatic amino acid ammonia-lyase [Bacteroidales bacterium]MDY6384894.1 aromatic amino acid ammonia-lyase [Bacteroidales bacterium]